jgi:hypothetical protein
MASILEVIEGISQALHAKHEGGTSFGLKRESEALVQGISIYDPRVIDGFGVQFQGDRLILKYHSEEPLIRVHNKNFETDTRNIVKQITKHLKEEYRKVTKKSLSLIEEGDIQILVQSANRRTCYINASQVYKISDVEIDSGVDAKSKKIYDSEQEQFADIAKRWLMNTKV